MKKKKSICCLSELQIALGVLCFHLIDQVTEGYQVTAPAGAWSRKGTGYTQPPNELPRAEMLGGSGALASGGPRDAGSFSSSRRERGRSDTDALRGRRGLWPVPVVPTVYSGTTSRFPSRREKSHVHKCPLVPKHKSCLSINCWSWITASGRAHPKTEIVTGSDNRHCGAWPGPTSTL